MGLEHLTGFFAEHDFGPQLPERVHVSCKTSCCDSNDVSLLEAPRLLPKMKHC
jgi:hypothetical protein